LRDIGQQKSRAGSILLVVRGKEESAKRGKRNLARELQMKWVSYLNTRG